jgi:hypothetical protein
VCATHTHQPFRYMSLRAFTPCFIVSLVVLVGCASRPLLWAGYDTQDDIEQLGQRPNFHHGLGASEGRAGQA